MMSMLYIFPVGLGVLFPVWCEGNDKEDGGQVRGNL